MLASRRMNVYSLYYMVERIITGPLHTNSFVVSTGRKSCLLIDPGVDAEKIWQSMERINLTPHTIVFTHGHIDHTAGALEIIEHYREKGVEIRVGIHSSDADYLGLNGEEINRKLLPVNNEEADEVFTQLFKPRPQADFYFSDGDSLPESDLQVIHTPGHTEGSVCFYSEVNSALFTGDSLFFDALGRTDYTSSNKDDLLNVLNSKIFQLPPETRIYPGHGPLSSLEREIRDDSFKTNHGMI
ncbi:Hydroxyacylglutathione hydrolase [Salinispira pacifica]|uniref:Hydroxyacylglutathione hydrolase n=2 Tax=Salinispira pacifica TaxID=1307761 RepID=V5WKK5_9SPIO|nr:Hydroxyacylglutathione hydrolase [Salinispira pacifica]